MLSWLGLKIIYIFGGVRGHFYAIFLIFYTRAKNGPISNRSAFVRLQADAELATLSGPPQRLAEACKIDILHNVGNRVIIVGIVNKFYLYVVLKF